MIWAALSMTAALVMTACTSEDNTVETPAAPQAEVKTIPYSVTVSGGATTRATVDEDMMTLRFAAGDKLYVFDGSSVVKGVLTLKSGDEGKSSGATFEGSLIYTGDEPADDLELNAVLVGSKSKLSTITDDEFSAGTYPTTSYCDDVATAVEEWSWLAGTGTYGEKSFTLSQSTTFLNFEITFEDGTKSGTTLTAVVKQNSTTTFCTADVTTKTEDGKVVAKFVLPLDDGYKLDGATVTMGDKEAISFGGDNQKLLGKVYNVKRTYAAPLNITSPAVGQVIGSDGKNYNVADVPSGVTKVAMIAYVGNASDCTNGLAIALADESDSKMDWSTAMSTCKDKTAVTGRTWRLPSAKDWQYMFIGCGSGELYSDPSEEMKRSYSGLASKLTTAGGTALQVGEDYNYWSSSEYDISEFAWSLRFVGNDAIFLFGRKDLEPFVRACLAFGPARGHALASSAVGEIVGSDGLAYYASDKNDLPSGVTAAGMVAYKNGSNGLVIALADEAGTMDWSTAITTAAAHTPAVSGQTWKLPSQDEWKQMFSANGGSDSSYSGLNTTITNAGGTGLREYDYWSSTELNENFAYYVTLIGGGAYFSDDNKGSDSLVRACLAF